MDIINGKFLGSNKNCQGFFDNKKLYEKKRFMDWRVTTYNVQIAKRGENGII